MTDPCRYFCSDASRLRGEAVVGTASRIDRWLLVEAPGAWSERSLPRARGLADDVLLAVQRRAQEAHARTLLLRRVGERADPGRVRRVFLADSRPGRERLLTRTVTDDELADLDLPFEAEAPAWTPVAALVGVCTQGAHDSCCAVRGRPVARALAASHPDIGWEVSHVGGDRFAANVLVLPGGHYLGGVEAADVGAAVDAVLRGERPDPWYRGRSCWATPVQAALALAGAELGITGLDALRPTSLVAAGDRRWRVDLSHEGVEVGVEVEQSRGPGTALLTCRADDEVPVPQWHLRSLVSS